MIPFSERERSLLSALEAVASPPSEPSGIEEKREESDKWIEQIASSSLEEFTGALQQLKQEDPALLRKAIQILDLSQKVDQLKKRAMRNFSGLNSSFLDREEIAPSVISFLGQKDRGLLAQVNSVEERLVREARGRVLQTINEQKKPLVQVARELDISLDELLESLEKQGKGFKRLEYLNLEGSDLSVEDIARVLSFCKEDVQIVVTIKNKTQEFLKEHLDLYEIFFSRTENSSFSLLIEATTVTEISRYSFIKELKVLSCPDLIKVELPQVKVADFSRCANLSTVSLLQADKVEFSECPNLTEVELPQVKVAGFLQCAILSTITLPKAEKVSLDGCRSLTTATLPLTKIASFEACRSIVDLDLPQAEKVDIGIFMSLRNLSIPFAKEVTIYRCPLITALHLSPNARLVCQECPSLWWVNSQPIWLWQAANYLFSRRTP